MESIRNLRGDKNTNTLRFLSIGLFLFLFENASSLPPVLSDSHLVSPPSKVIRTCCAFGDELRISVVPFVRISDAIELNDLGEHEFLGGVHEGNGIIYTKHGGFIDLGHLRDYADWTAYLYAIMDKKKGQTIVLDLGREGGSKSLSIKIQPLISETELSELAGAIAYELSMWHEIATWFGASYVPFIPEKYSSFSPEDLYSNLLGIHLGIQALQSELGFNEAMTSLIIEAMHKLEAVNSSDETLAALKKVDGLWWNSRKRLPNSRILLKRNYGDIDGIVPWLLPGTMDVSHPYELKKPRTFGSEVFQLNIRPGLRIPFRKFCPVRNTRWIDQGDFHFFVDYISEVEANRFDKSD